MQLLMDLWAAILASTAGVWFTSAIAWMVLPHHHKDHRALPNEGEFIRNLKDLAVPPGSYGFPFCATNEDRKDPERMRMWKEGPAGFMTIMGPMSMGRNMALSILVNLVVSVFVAYLASLAIERGAGFLEVFRFTATAGVMAYLFGWMGSAIWFGMPRNAWISNSIDSVMYGLITGAAFALLWPGAANG